MDKHDLKLIQVILREAKFPDLIRWDCDKGLFYCTCGAKGKGNLQHNPTCLYTLKNAALFAVEEELDKKGTS